MTVLIVGSGGQLGRALLHSKPQGASVVAQDYPEVDLSNDDSVEQAVANAKPSLIFNAAAYTAVDKAEGDKGLAFTVNAGGVDALAVAAERYGARFIHISTDYVFDGSKGYPYTPNDHTSPLGVYGKSKLAGEERALANCNNSLIVRTAWLYAEDGVNFVKTMLRLMSSRTEIRVVADQIGTPTYAGSLANALWHLAKTDKRGILHFTDAGVASWYDFACAIQDEALRLGMLDRTVSIVPIATSDYPLPAPRPSFSILDKSEAWALLGGPAAHWRANLRLVLENIKNG